MSECHLFILWENARVLEQQILDDIRLNFSLISTFEIEWSKEYVSDNFSRFYGTNLPPNSGKEQHCGSGPFLLIVVRDDNPQYDYRDTSRGPEMVNTNLFDAKSKYREWTGGGHKIHATNTPAEFNHDITLLLGVNADDFMKKHSNNTIEKLHKNIVGAEGWDSLEQVFYVLNATINYVVLRGKEDIATGIFRDEHRDIDLLLDDYDNAKWIINGVSSCNKYRPHEKININGYDYYFDLWQPIRLYFDWIWSTKMLKNRVLSNNIFVLSQEDEFYSLIYHCLLVKGHITNDYEEKLSMLKSFIKPKGNDYGQILVSFLSKNNYDITYPADKSITLHFDDKNISSYAFRHGKFVSQTYKDNSHIVPFFSVVYEKENSFYKRATDFLIETEYMFLKQLETYKYFPEVLTSGEAADGAFIEISRIEGEDFETFFSSFRHQQLKYIKSFIQELFNALLILNEHQIIHRDITHRNILVKTNEGNVSVGIIDFGWAIHISDINTCKKPDGLGLWYACPIAYSDFYSMGIILNILIKRYWGTRPYVIKIANALLEISGKDYNNPAVMNQKLELVKSAIASRQCLTDIRRECGLLYRWGKSFIKYKLQKITK